MVFQLELLAVDFFVLLLTLLLVLALLLLLAVLLVAQHHATHHVDVASGHLKRADDVEGSVGRVLWKPPCRLAFQCYHSLCYGFKTFHD